VRTISRALLYAAPLVAALTLVAGCGGSDGEDSATQWADSVCGSVTTWQSAVTDAVESVQASPSRDSVQNAVGDVRDATDKLGDDLDEAGKPDTESGDRAKETLDELRANLDDGLGTIENAIDDASDTGVLTAVSTVSATLATMRTQITSAVDEIEQLDTEGELRSAFSNADACDDLQK
jgi:hypothetical protein